MRQRPFLCLAVRLRGAVALLLCAILLVAAASIPNALAVDASGTLLPVIMYHSVLKEEARSGKYIVSPRTVEADFAYLKQHGYTALLPSELARSVHQGRPLPPKPVMITFDDGFLNNLTYILPLLEQYHMKATVAVVGAYSERFSQTPDPSPAYAHLSWEDITALDDSKRVEIANHSYDMHKQSPRKGSQRRLGESASDYYQALIADAGRTQSLLEENCGILPTTYAYPFGQTSPESIPILQEMGFTVLLTCSEQVNQIGSDPDVLLSLGRFNRPGGVSTERFMRRIGIR